MEYTLQFVNLFPEAHEIIDLVLKIHKTKVLNQPVPPIVRVHIETWENMDHVPYLRSYLSAKGDIDDEI